MATKVTFFMSVSPVYNETQTFRVAGFSESWYHPSETQESVIKDAITLATARAKLLPKQGSILAQRYQIVPADGKPKAGQVRLAFYPGNSNYDTDVPNMAYQFRAYAVGKQNRCIRQVKGFPDQFVVQGEAKLSPAFTRDLNAYFRILSDTWNFRGIKMDAATVDVDTITAGGTVNTVDDFAYPGDKKKVQIIRTKQKAGRDDYAGQIVKTVTAVTLRSFTVSDWKGGECTGGRVRPYSHDFFAIDPGIFPEAVYVHKVGRPFFQYRGRASARS